MAQKARIAQLYVQVIPSMDGFFKDIEKETKDKVPRQSKETGDRWSKGFRAGLKDLFKDVSFSKVFDSIKGFKLSNLFNEGGGLKNIFKSINFDELKKGTSAALSGIGAILNKGLAGAGNFLGDVLKRGVQAAKIGALVLGGLAVAGVATVVSKGFSRALNIEDAQASLKGLGYEAEQIKAVTDDVLKSVQGTAFGLDETMSIAATALAAGIPQGAELEKYLKTIADTATITKSSMSEIGPILNKVTAGGRAYTQELNQLQDRGLPVFAWLQSEMGVTAEEMRKMVSSGAISSAQLMAVLEKNIGGAAQASGDTVRGAWANTMAALSRLGAAGVGASLPYLKDSLNLIMPAIDSLTEKLKPLAEQFWATFGPRMVESVGKLMDWLIGLVDTLASGEGGFDNLETTISQIFDIIKNYASVLIPVFAQLMTSLLEVLKVVAPIMGEFGKFLSESEDGARFLAEIIGAVLILKIVAMTAALWAMIAPILANPLTWIILGAVAAIALLIAGIWLIADNWDAIIGGIVFGIEAFNGFIAGVFEGIMSFFVGIAKAIANFFAGSINNVFNGLNFLVSLINSLSFSLPDWFLGGATIGFNIPTLPTLPTLATGGNIAASAGGTPVIVGEGGRAETVTDLGLTNALIQNSNSLALAALGGSGGGAGGDTQVNISIVQKDNENAEDLVRLLDEYFTLNSLKPAGWAI